MKTTISIIALALTFSIFTSCKNEAPQPTIEAPTVEKEVKEHSKDVHWSHHEGEDGPANWKNLSHDFAACGEHAQSPINIISDEVLKGSDLSKAEFAYGNSKANIVNNGHTVQFNIDEGSSVKLNGKKYQLLQFHYHALSEHTINGEHAPLEVHFVHKHSDTDFAVIGAMYTEGKENELLKTYLDKFPKEKGTFNAEEMFDILNLLPEDKDYYHYKGSLTTPPCSEVVNWYVLKNPIEASKEQLAVFSEILKNNYRPIQELNDRKVLEFND